jgi:hypothetical protein
MKHSTNHVGVWLDHHLAHFIYPKGNGKYAIETMESPHDRHPREEGKGSDDSSYRTFLGNRASNNEYRKHNIENDQLHDYYRELKTVLDKYDEVLVFGPTTAGNELFNLMLTDKGYDGKKLWLEKTDKMTENQLKAYVKEYFTKEMVLK